MGTLAYSLNSQKIPFEDRVLAHVELVIVQKLRRGESFTFTITRPVEAGSGRAKLWIHPAVPLVFEYDGSKPPRINRTWLNVLMASANSSNGLILTEEPQDTLDHPSD